MRNFVPPSDSGSLKLRGKKEITLSFVVTAQNGKETNFVVACFSLFITNHLLCTIVDHFPGYSVVKHKQLELQSGERYY